MNAKAPKGSDSHLTSGIRPLTSDHLVIATHNPGKLAEMRELLAPYGITVKTAGELDLVEPDENGMTFGENACIKAETAAHAARLPALADDSGLAVQALEGAPGIHSARWAGLAGRPYGKIRGARCRHASVAAARHPRFRLRSNVFARWPATDLWRNVERGKTRIAAARQRPVASRPRFHEARGGLP